MRVEWIAGITEAKNNFILYFPNAFCRKDEFAERRGDLHSKPKKRQKFRDVLEDQKRGDYYDYYADYSNAFGHGDYDTQFRDLIQQHYAEDEFYDYEAELQTNIRRSFYNHRDSPF